jgi:hypothetical protein
MNLLILFATLLIATQAKALSPECLSELVTQVGNPSAVAEMAHAYRKPLSRGQKFNSELALLIDYTKSSREQRAFFIDLPSCNVMTASTVVRGGVTPPRLQRSGPACSPALAHPGWKQLSGDST